MRGFQVKVVGVVVLLSFVFLLHVCNLARGTLVIEGGDSETLESTVSNDLRGSGKVPSSDKGDMGGDDPKFSLGKKVMRRLGSRQGPSPPAPSLHRMKSMVFHAPPPQAVQ